MCVYLASWTKCISYYICVSARQDVFVVTPVWTDNKSTAIAPYYSIQLQNIRFKQMPLSPMAISQYLTMSLFYCYWCKNQYSACQIHISCYMEAVSAHCITHTAGCTSLVAKISWCQLNILAICDKIVRCNELGKRNKVFFKVSTANLQVQLLNAYTISEDISLGTIMIIST